MTYYLGIDVGAARASAAVARAGSDDVEPVDLGDGGCGVASVLHLGADGSLDVDLEVASESWLRQLLFRVAPHASVVAPPEFAESFISSARAAVRLYSRPGVR